MFASSARIFVDTDSYEQVPSNVLLSLSAPKKIFKLGVSDLSSIVSALFLLSRNRDHTLVFFWTHEDKHAHVERELRFLDDAWKNESEICDVLTICNSIAEYTPPPPHPLL